MNSLLHKLIAATGAGLVFVVMALAFTGTEPWQEAGDGQESMDALVEGLFTDHVITLEVLGVLLTAAMIGALVIARPLGAPDDSTHYGHPSHALVAATQHITDDEGTHHAEEEE